MTTLEARATLWAVDKLGGSVDLRIFVMISGLMASGCANPCESLCEAYFQMELRCDLLACEDAAIDPPLTCSAEPAQGTCPRDGDGVVDENGALQATEYAIQQCQADYRRLKPSDGQLASEGAACQSYLPDLESLLQEYDDASDSCTQLQLCGSFYILTAEMGLEATPSP